MSPLSKALHNIYRQRWISFATLLVLTLMVVIFNLAFALQSFAEKNIESISTKVDITVELLPDLENIDREVLLEKVNLRSEVREARLISSTEAEDFFLSLHPEISEYLEEDTLPTLLNITVKNPGDQQPISEFLKTQTNYLDISSIQTSATDNSALGISASASEELSRLVKITNSLFAGTTVVLIISLLAITLNAVYLSLFSRKDEIIIMQLVGAAYGFIRRPYIYEGMIISVLAVILGDILFNVFINVLGWQSIMNNLSLGSILLGQIIVALLVGGIASLMATNLFLKKQSISL